MTRRQIESVTPFSRLTTRRLRTTDLSALQTKACLHRQTVMAIATPLERVFRFSVDASLPTVSNPRPSKGSIGMTGKQRTKPEQDFYANLGGAIRVARIAVGKSQGDVAEH